MGKAKASAQKESPPKKRRESVTPTAPPLPQRGEEKPPESSRRAENEAFAENTYRVALPQFEGPLDLLLHLIQQHELDILDIPVSFITQKYLEYLSLMRSMSIDIASEYLVMAATLTHIKSKMLLPVVPSGQEGDGMPEEEEDPRAELVRRLLEYQKYKAAGADLAERGTLGKDVFGRGIPEPVPEGPAPFAPVAVFSLLEAFEKLLKKTNVKIDHQVVFDRISITDRIVQLTELLEVGKRAMFEDLVLNDPARKGAPLTKFDIVITFLAILEMARMKLLRIYQTDPLAPIHLELAMAPTSEQLQIDEEEVFGPKPKKMKRPEPEPEPEPDETNEAEEAEQLELLFEERDEAADELDEAALREALDTEPSAGEPEVKDGD